MKVLSADEEYEMSDEEKQTLASTHEKADTRVFIWLLQSEVEGSLHPYPWISAWV